MRDAREAGGGAGTQRREAVRKAARAYAELGNRDFGAGDTRADELRSDDLRRRSHRATNDAWICDRRGADAIPWRDDGDIAKGPHGPHGLETVYLTTELEVREVLRP